MQEVLTFKHVRVLARAVKRLSFGDSSSFQVFVFKSFNSIKSIVLSLFLKVLVLFVKVEIELVDLAFSWGPLSFLDEIWKPVGMLVY